MESEITKLKSTKPVAVLTLMDESNIIQDLLSELLDEISYDNENNAFDIYTIRQTKSICSIASSDAGDLSAFSDDESISLEPIQSDSDSEVEFERYLQQTTKWKKKIFIQEHSSHLETKRFKPQRIKDDQIDDEYDALPGFSSLNIDDKKEFSITKFGIIKNIVGCIAVISPEIETTLDLETAIFDENKVAIGQVADVIGTVKEPLYCMKLPENPLNVGQHVYYAPMEESLTKTILGANLEAPWQANQISNDEEEVLFSDDEEEKAYRQKTKSKLNSNKPRGRKRGNVQFNLTGEQQEKVTNNWNWNQSTRKTYKQYEYPQDIEDEKPNLSGIPPAHNRNASAPNTTTKPRFSYLKQNRKPNNTVVPNNPYPELGCYDEFLK